MKKLDISVNRACSKANIVIRLTKNNRQNMFGRKGVLKNFATFIGIHLCRILFVIKVAGCSYTILSKRLPQVFSREFCETFKNSYFTEHSQATASVSYILNQSGCRKNDLSKNVWQKP